MAIKAGELIHVGNTVLIDRLQTAGPGDLNIPTERIHELGNYESVATIRDIPDLQFPMESLDVSTQMEALLLGSDAAADPQGHEYDLARAVPLDVLGQFKAGKQATDPFSVVGSVVVPYLNIESVSYRLGLRDNASQSVQFRGDSVFYSQVSAFVEEVEGTDVANQEITLENEPIPYNGDSVAGTRYALSVSIVETGRRLILGTDYTETQATITILNPVPTDQHVRIAYQSEVEATYPQASHAEASATRPAAIKGRDIEVRVGGQAITNRWSSVQSVNVDWRVQLERDEEFGNPNVVAQDFDVPDVDGQIQIRPRSPVELVNRIKEIAGVTGVEVVGPYQSVVTTLDILLHSPDSGNVLKTLHVPDCRFTLPGYSGQVEQKLDVDFPFESDGGKLLVYKGERAAA